MRTLIVAAALALGTLGFVSTPTADAGWRGHRGYHGGWCSSGYGGWSGHNAGWGYNRGYYGGSYGARPYWSGYYGVATPYTGYRHYPSVGYSYSYSYPSTGYCW